MSSYNLGIGLNIFKTILRLLLYFLLNVDVTTMDHEGFVTIESFNSNITQFF